MNLNPPADLPQRLAERWGSVRERVAEVDGDVAGFLLAMREDCAYRNDNYAWFSSRYSSFLYVDRIVVDAGYGGSGMGTLLYKDIFEHARTDGVPIISCEYNLVPENHASRIFHDKFRFREVGTQWLADGTKKVSLQAAEVSLKGSRSSSRPSWR